MTMPAFLTTLFTKMLPFVGTVGYDGNIGIVGKVPVALIVGKVCIVENVGLVGKASVPNYSALLFSI